MVSSSMDASESESDSSLELFDELFSLATAVFAEVLLVGFVFFAFAAEESESESDESLLEVLPATLVLGAADFGCTDFLTSAESLSESDSEVESESDDSEGFVCFAGLT